jgi:LPXTG-motif cell wall-anchored protein
MIQRIQTLYLAICFIASGVFPFFVSIWIEKNGEVTQAVYFTESTTAMVLFGLSALLAVISIFSFKKRQNQFVLNRLNIISNFILLGFFVYRTLNLSGETLVSEKGIGITLPAISIVLLVLANRAIKKDEDLVKSVDRLR